MKYIYYILLILTMIFPNITMAEDIDYDSIMIGIISNYHRSNGKYYFDFNESENSPDSYTYTGKIDDKIDKQVKKVIKEIKKSKNNVVVLKLSMDSPVCIQPVKEEILYIQPKPILKDKYAIITLCIPETDNCWKMKLSKSNPQYEEITTSLLSNEVTAYYTTNNELLACYSSNTSFISNNAVQYPLETSQKSIYSPRINDVFDHQNINTTIQYFDKKYGPAKIDNGDYREYDIGGCNITVKGDKNVESISLKLNPQCNVDMSKFLNNGTSAYGMTFGDFERNSISMDYVAHCFAGSCGNMLDAYVDAHGILSRDHNFLELKASVTINTEASVDASLRVTSEIRELNEYDFLIEHTAFCTEKDSKIIKNHFKNIKIDTITIGYNLKEKCDENDNIQSNSYDSTIDIVKNGKLKLDTSTTISGAFSGYKYFNHTKDNWTSFKDEQGRTVVEYKTEYVFREDIKLGLKEYGKKADLLTAAGYRGFDEINFVNWARTKADSVKPEFHVQFYVSDDGNFQVNFVGIIDPKTYSFVSGVQMIYAIYENQPLNIAFDFYKELKKKMR